MGRGRAFGIVSAVLRVGAGAGLCAVGIAAGWHQLWVVLALLLALVAAHLAVLAVRNPQLLEARLAVASPSRSFDRVYFAGTIAVTAALIGVAALDVLVWRATLLPPWVTAVGAALWLVGDIPVLLAMAANPHLEPTVEVRPGQVVADRGPYAVVRHPMYSGVSLMFVALPLVLGSLLALVPALGLVALLVYRTSREDRTLQDELPGYAAYASRTRARLLPGLW